MTDVPIQYECTKCGRTNDVQRDGISIVCGECGAAVTCYPNGKTRKQKRGAK